MISSPAVDATWPLKSGTGCGHCARMGNPMAVTVPVSGSRIASEPSCLPMTRDRPSKMNAYADKPSIRSDRSPIRFPE